MNTIPILLFTLLREPGIKGTGYDAAPPVAIIGIGLLIIIAIAVVLILVIVFSIKFLKRIRNKSGNTPQ